MNTDQEIKRDDGVGRDDLWRLVTYQFEDLKFADQKAIALLGITGLVAGVVTYISAIAKPTSSLPKAAMYAVGALMVIGDICAIFATCNAVVAIMPRGLAGAKRSVFKDNPDPEDVGRIPHVHLVQIRSYPSHERYLAALDSFDTRGFDTELARDCHRMATIANIKYSRIINAVWWVTAELICFLCGLALGVGVWMVNL